jgi:hypothetical protein
VITLHDASNKSLGCRVIYARVVILGVEYIIWPLLVSCKRSSYIARRTIDVFPALLSPVGYQGFLVVHVPLGLLLTVLGSNVWPYSDTDNDIALAIFGNLTSPAIVFALFEVGCAGPEGALGRSVAAQWRGRQAQMAGVYSYRVGTTVQ